MSLRLRQIIIPTANKNLLASFLSELLELELQSEGDGIRLIGEGLELLLVQATQVSGNLKNGPIIDWAVASLEELDDLQQKVSFFKYRYQLPEHEEESITQIGRVSYFFLKDPEGRKWKFSFSDN